MIVLIYVLLLCFLLFSPIAVGKISTTFCTVVNITDSSDKEKSLILYRSLRISDINQDIKLLYACIPVSTYSTGFDRDDAYFLLLSDLGVVPIEIPLFNTYYQSDNYLPIECGLKVSDIVAGYSERLDTMGVVYIDKKYFVVRSLYDYTNSLLNMSIDSNNIDVACRNLDARTIISRKKALASLDRIPFGPCDFNFFMISSRIGTALYSYVNSSVGLNMDPDRFVTQYNQVYSDYSIEEWGRYHNSIDSYIHRFYLGVATLSKNSLRFFTQSDIPVVFANKDWSSEYPYLIEFDNAQHILTIDAYKCSLNCYVEWKQFFTVDVIGDTMGELLLNYPKDIDAFNILVGCQNPNVLLALESVDRVKVDKYQFINKNEANSGVTATSNATPVVEDNIKIFDGIIFSDEISLLLLRMEYLYDVIDYHIIVECRTSFSGRSKPLVYDENKHLFEKYRHKIHHLILDKLAFTPGMLDEVWANEYYSRNMLTYVLNRVDANDNDILLVSDTDEIPHPNALRNMRLYQQKPNNLLGTDKIYKFNMKNYLYNFNCFDYKQFNKFTPLTGASIGTAKRLCDVRDMKNVNFSYPTCMRLYLQHEDPFPFETVLSPGGWHLSFFSNIERIQNKLQNYGHQQFLEQFNAENIQFDLDNRTIDKELKASLLKLDGISLEEINRNISLDLLKHRVENGIHINYNNIDHHCLKEEFYQLDQYDLDIRALWNEMMTEADRI